jgi:excisionase family DNA binding protein
MANTSISTYPAVLGSWKEVAAYLGKGVRTVQRWEKDDGLPVRRISGTSKIVAYREDLDRWLRSQPAQHSEAIDVATAESFEQMHRNIDIGKDLRKRNALLLESVKAAVHCLMEECTRAVSVTSSASPTGDPVLDSCTSPKLKLIAAEKRPSQHAS